MVITVIGTLYDNKKNDLILRLSSEIKPSLTIDCNNEIKSRKGFSEKDIVDKRPYFGNKVAFVDKRTCIRCGICTRACKFESIDTGEVNESTCTGCGACEAVCPPNAIVLKNIKSADIYLVKIESAKILFYEKHTDYFDVSKLIVKLIKISEEPEFEKDTVIINSIIDIPSQNNFSISKSDLTLIAVEVKKEMILNLKETLKICKTFKVHSLVYPLSKLKAQEELEIQRICKENCKALILRDLNSTAEHIELLNFVKTWITKKEFLSKS